MTKTMCINDRHTLQTPMAAMDLGMTMNIYTPVTDRVKEETANKFAKYVNF